MKILKVLIILFIIIFLIAIFDPDCFHEIAKALRLKILPSSIFNNNSAI